MYVGIGAEYVDGAGVFVDVGLDTELEDDGSELYDVSACMRNVILHGRLP